MTTWMHIAAEVAAQALQAGEVVAFKGLLIMLLAFAAAGALRRGAAATRHLIWTLALAGLLVLPALNWLVPALAVPVLPSPNASAARTAALAPLRGNSALSQAPPPAPATVERATIGAASPDLDDTDFVRADALLDAAAPRLRAPLSILLLWFILATALAAPIVIGLGKMSRTLRRAQPLDLAAAERVRRLLAEARGVRVLQSASGAMPMAAGWLRPVILLPPEIALWSDEKLRSVLIHEWAHVVRRDCLVQALASLACALHWFNPLAWLALRRMRLERERACDDMALLAGQKASAYAAHLLQIAAETRAPNLPIAVATTMASAGQLETRVQAVLDPRRRRRALKWTGVLLGGLIVLAIALPLAAIKFEEMRIFSQMTPEIRADFEKWYTEKVSLTPEELEIKPFSAETIDAVRSFDREWAARRNDPFVKGPAPLPKDMDAFVAVHHAEIAALEPLRLAFRAVTQRPDYSMEAWSTPTGLRPADKFARADFAAIRFGARLSQWNALAQCKAGDFAAASENAGTLVAAAQVDGPTSLVDRMIGVALLGLGIDAWQMIADGVHDDSQRRGIAQKLTGYRGKLPLTFPASEDKIRAFVVQDQIGFVGAARRAGIAADYQNKTGYEIMLESQRVNADYLERAALSQAANEREAGAIRKQIEDDRNLLSLNGQAGGWRKLLSHYTEPANAARLYTIALPGIIKAHTATLKRREDYDKLIAAFEHGA